MRKDYRIKVKIQNANILRAIEATGYKSVAELCRVFHMEQTMVSAFINFRSSPVWQGDTEAAGSLTEKAKLLCLALDVLPEDLWSDEQLGLVLGRNASFVDVRQDELELAIRNLDHRKLIGELQKASKPRRLAATQRYFSADEPTLAEVGDELGVTQERIRQMTCQTLREMRRQSAGGRGAELVDLD